MSSRWFTANILAAIGAFGSLCYGQSKALDVQAYQEKYPRHDGVILHYERYLGHTLHQGLFTGKLKWTLAGETQMTLLVLNPDNKFINTIHLDRTAGQQFLTYQVKVTPTNGAPTRHNLLAKKQPKKFAVPGLSKGSIIEISWSSQVKSTNMGAALYFDEPLQFPLPCESIRLKYRFPEDWIIQVKDIAKTTRLNYGINMSSDGKYRSLTFQPNHGFPALAEEPYSPFQREIAHYLELQITKIETKNAIYKSPGSWSDLSRYLEFPELTLNRATIKQLQKKAAEITKHTTDSLGAQQAIVSYVQTHNLDSWKGPLKKCFLTIHLLTLSGFRANLLLVHSVLDGYFDKKFVNLNQVPYPAVISNLENEQQILFPYIENLPVNQIPETFQGQMALKLNAHKLIRLPQNSPEENKTEEHYQVSLKPNGILGVRERKLYRGSTAFWARGLLRELDESEKDEALKKLLTYDEGDLTILTTEFVNLHEPEKPFVVVLEYEIDNLLTLTPEEVLFNTGGLLSPISRTKYKIDPSERQNPIKIPFGERVEKSITLNYPTDWEPDLQATPIRFENSFGTIEAAYERQKGRLVIHQKTHLFKREAPRSRAWELLEIIGSRSILAIPHIIFERVLDAPKDALQP